MLCDDCANTTSCTSRGARLRRLPRPLDLRSSISVAAPRDLESRALLQELLGPELGLEVKLVLFLLPYITHKLLTKQQVI
jgi:hypothetical protein